MPASETQQPPAKAGSGKKQTTGNAAMAQADGGDDRTARLRAKYQTSVADLQSFIAASGGEDWSVDELAALLDENYGNVETVFDLITEGGRPAAAKRKKEPALDAPRPAPNQARHRGGKTCRWRSPRKLVGHRATLSIA
jgi:hypothetical protein